MGTSQMRSKTFILLLLCIVATTVLFCYFSDQRPIHNFVSQTHKQLSNLGNLKKTVVPKTELTTDKKYLDVLGFASKPHLYPQYSWSQNSSLPVVVTAIVSSDRSTVHGFVKSIQKILHQHSIIIYDLGLGSSELVALKEFCNATNCLIHKFIYDNYPSHVSDLKLSAYRPIIIQEVLDFAGAVLWLDVNTRIINTDITKLFKLSEANGVVAWSGNSKQPTSALTHHRMFEFFQTDEINYYFHRMVDADHLLVYNLKDVHYKLMLPWLQCVLTAECIAPIGAQRSGCRFDKKPLYRYSGCHRYDVSALNVVLGIMYDYDYHKYLVNSSDYYFRPFYDLEDEETTASFKTANTRPLTKSSPPKIGKARVKRIMRRRR